MLKVFFHDVGYADGSTSVGMVIAAGKKIVPEEIEELLGCANWERYDIKDAEIGVVYEVSMRSVAADEGLIMISNLKEHAEAAGDGFEIDLCIHPDFKRGGKL